MKILKIKKIMDVKTPTRNFKTDAGLDLYLPIDTKIIKGSPIPLGIAIKLKKGYMAQVIERSSIGKKGISFAKSPIDAGYTGQIHIIPLDNFDHKFKKGERLAQLLITKVSIPKIEIVKKFKSTERGSDRFGSSGK